MVATRGRTGVHLVDYLVVVVGEEEEEEEEEEGGDRKELEDEWVASALPVLLLFALLLL